MRRKMEKPEEILEEASYLIVKGNLILRGYSDKAIKKILKWYAIP